MSCYIFKSSLVPHPWLLITARFPAYNRGGVGLSDATWLFSPLTQQPSHSSKHRILQPQPRGHLRLTPTRVGETLFEQGDVMWPGLFLSLGKVTDSLNHWDAHERGSWRNPWSMQEAKHFPVVWMGYRKSILRLSGTISSSTLLGLRLKLMSVSCARYQWIYCLGEWQFLFNYSHAQFLSE